MSSKGRQRNIEYDLTGLDNLLMNLRKNSYTKVGVLSENTSRNNSHIKFGESKNINNALLGMRMEYGWHPQRAFTAINTSDRKQRFTIKSIPPRSWLRMPIELMIKFLPQALEAKREKIERALISTFESKSNYLLDIIGKNGVKFIKKAFASKGFGKWIPNSLAWQAFKGNSKPLDFTGQLKNAISHKTIEHGKKS